MSGELGYDRPAELGMGEAEVVTPCLVLDLDALERNLRRMGEAVRGLRFRPHGKMHKSVDVARLQHEIGGAEGICCQKVSEAEAFVRGGIDDVLVTNEVRQKVMRRRLARLAKAAKVTVCIDDAAAVEELSRAAVEEGVVLGVYVELEAGGGRCGVSGAQEAVALARAVEVAEGLRFDGIQAYRGNAQHIADYAARARALEETFAMVRATVAALESAGLPPRHVSGAGTGSFRMEAASGLYTELQCGSYAFMDADYGQIEAPGGGRLDSEWENALFVLTSVLSHDGAGRAVGDAGLKAHTAESGLPHVFGRPDLEVTGLSDEHCVIADPGNTLKVGDKLRLVPGHCDPTCNLHDWYVGLRGDVVECLWPVSARGKVW